MEEQNDLEEFPLLKGQRKMTQCGPKYGLSTTDDTDCDYNHCSQVL